MSMGFLTAGIALLIAGAPAPQDESDSLRKEFDRLIDGKGLSRLPEIERLLFSPEEADFVRGAEILREWGYTNEHAEVKRDISLIAFRRARAKRWKSGYDAAESLILAYYPRRHDGTSTFLQTVANLLKGDEDPRSRKTLRLVALLECYEDRDFLLELSTDPRSMYRSVALHHLSNYGGPEDTRLIAAFLKDEVAHIRRSALISLIDRRASEHASEIAGLFDDAYCRDVVISAIGKFRIQKFAKRLVEILDSADSSKEGEHFQAFHALRSLDPVPVVDDVTVLLCHNSPKVRLMAVRLLGHWRIRQQESAISASLRDDDAFVREAAVEALADLPAKVSGGSLEGRLEDPQPEVRNRAAVALGRLNHARAADRIVAAAKKGQIFPAAAAEALMRMTPPARADVILELLDALAREPFRMGQTDCVVDFDRKKCLEFHELLPIVVEQGLVDCMVSLMKRWKDYPVQNRQHFLYAISGRGRIDLVNALDKQGLLDDPEVLSAALSVYSRTLTAKDVPSFIALFRRLDPQGMRRLGFAGSPFIDEYATFADDPDPTVRRLVVQVLSRDPKLRHLARLLKFAEDADPTVRAGFAHNAACIASTEHHETVGRLLDDPDPNVVSAAIDAVPQLGLKRYAPRLAELTKDDKHRVSAMYAIARLGAKEHSATLVPMLRDPGSATYAAQWLALLGAPERVPDLLRTVEEGDPAARAEALKAAAILGGPIPKLADLLDDKEDKVRAAAATAAGILRDKNLAAKLAGLLKDPSYRVKAAAIGALADLDARDHIPTILEFLELHRLAEDENVRAKFYAENGPQVAVQASAEALGRMGNAESLRELGRHWRRARGVGVGQILEPSLLRLDARKFLAPILARYGEEYGLPLVKLMNEVGAPRLYESIKSRALATRWHHEHGSLDRLASKLSDALGIKVGVSPSVPNDVRNRSRLMHGFDKDRNAGILSFLHGWHECVPVYDEGTGAVTFMTPGEAKRFWLEWARKGR